jgi:arabinose-5-phosphate isomerase
MIKAVRSSEHKSAELKPAQHKPEPSAAANPTLELARKVLAIEADAVRALIERLDGRFLAAVDLIRNRHGRVVVSGIGKSGHVARKIASTMASTGTPAYFVHPAEASHGDLGMVESGDVFIAISYSGESSELAEILPLLKRRGAKLIALTGNPESLLAREADVHLDATVAQEACPLNLAPTASTTAALALGDALAVALLDARGFSAADFASSHPRGKLPRQALAGQALLHVAEVMRTGAAVPSVPSGSSVRQAMLEMSRGGLGMTAVLDAAGAVKGVFTDGDLRRALEKSTDIDGGRVDQVMTPNPKTIGRGKLAAEAVHLMEQHKISQLLVVDERGVLAGALNMHDLFRVKVI